MNTRTPSVPLKSLAGFFIGKDNPVPFVGSATPPTSTNYGKQGQMITISGDTTVPANAKAIVVVTAGNLVFRPVGNPPGQNITITGAAVGFTPPYVVGTIIETGTTAALATVEDE